MSRNLEQIMDDADFNDYEVDGPATQQYQYDSSSSRLMLYCADSWLNMQYDGNMCHVHYSYIFTF